MFMKKTLLGIALSASLLIAPAYAEENHISQETLDKIEEVKENNPEMFVNQPLSEEDQKIQELIIQRLNEVYFSKETLNKDEKFELLNLYTSAIMQGFNEAAEEIWQFSEGNPDFNLNVNLYNKSGVTPLIAASISEMEGGNVEYALTLLKRGASPDQVTVKNNINAMSLAASVDNYKVLTALIVSGGNYMKKDDFGLTPAEYAEKHDSERSLFILMKMQESLKNAFEQEYNNKYNSNN